MKQKTCAHCHTRFLGDRDRTKYCSRKCFDDARTKPLDQRFWERVDKRGPDECWPWLSGTNALGYGGISTGKRPAASLLAHRVSWMLHQGQIPDGLDVLHSCDNPPCVNPAHLWLGTRADNNIDRHLKGRDAVLPGEKNGRAKLTSAQVLEVRAARGKQADIGRRYGIIQSTVCAIKARRLWKHLEDPS